MTQPAFSTQTVQSCCVSLYSHPLVGWLLGNSLHPGGLKLTEQLTDLLELDSRSHVLDIGSGTGASAVHIAKRVRCRVTGITLEPSGVESGTKLAIEQGVPHLVNFIEGDFHTADLDKNSFDAVLMECVLSTIPDKPAALARIVALLKPGGRLGLTDVTVDGPLPSDLDAVLLTAGCVGGALPLDDYRALVKQAGLTINGSQPLPQVAQNFMRDLSGKLMMAEAATKLGKIEIPDGGIDTAKALLASARDAATNGRLGYALLTAIKPN
ncbi:MAG: methyltransferase domain-containing protein [Chloroflexi bacterium]|nr:methyltransferase domain-containing protein [Chloroflexota bacterium]